MSDETKILFENIKDFRHLLTEAVSDKSIMNAIENHEWLYIFYRGDNTIETGYRTIRPFVLGTVGKDNNLALRAWQDKGRSDSLRPDAPRNRLHHEHETDTDGVTKPGWRLFLVDKITSAIPIGRKFNDNNGRVMIPTGYKEHDAQMNNIVAAISAAPEKEIQAKTSGETSAFKTQTSKFQSFYNANKNNRRISKGDVQNLYDVAKKVMKKSPNNYFVVINDKNEFSIKDIRQKNKYPPNSIVGDLSFLYDMYVRKTTPVSTDTKFFDQSKNNALKNATKKSNIPLFKENIEKFPIQRKTFFK